MSDLFGPLPVPLVAPKTGEAVADPFISTTLSFFAAVLNANAPAAWRAVFKDVPNAPVVKGTFTDDPEPENGVFNESQLPALFFWRSDVRDPVYIAEDWLTQESRCTLLWVMPPAADRLKRSLRTSVINGIARTLMMMVERDCDPSWVVPGDLDPKAATRGSLFSVWGAWMEFMVGAWKPYQLKVRMLDRGAPPRPYDAVRITCRVVERLTYDLTVFDASAGGMDLTTKTTDGGVGDGGFITGHQLNLP